jgi:YHS domain-containing protein
MIRSLLAAASLLFSTLALAVAPPASAADEVNVSTGATLAGPGLAVHGHDVVAYFRGDGPVLGSDKYAYAYKGGAYRFANQANLDAFKAAPEKYVPAYGGFCAYGVALGKKFDGDPRFWKIVDGKLYLNLNGDIQSEWSKDIPANIGKAETNWANIHAVAAAKL